MKRGNVGAKNGNWLGDKVSIFGIHKWVRRNKPKVDLCEECKTNKPHDLANISQKYKRDINDFEWLCRRCHMKKDGRIYKLATMQVGRLAWSHGKNATTDSRILGGERNPMYGKKHSEEARRKMKLKWAERKLSTESGYKCDLHK